MDRRSFLRHAVAAGVAAATGAGAGYLLRDNSQECVCVPTSIETTHLNQHKPEVKVETQPGYVAPLEGQPVYILGQLSDLDKDDLEYALLVNNNLVDQGTLRYENDSWLIHQLRYSAKAGELNVGRNAALLSVTDGQHLVSVPKEFDVDVVNRYPLKQLKNVPIKGVNLIVGHRYAEGWAPPLRDDQIDESLDVIKNELDCNGIKLRGDYVDVLLRATEMAIEKGFESIVVSPRYMKTSYTSDVTIDEHVQMVIDFSKRLESVRHEGQPLILCVGEELEIGVKGIATADSYEGRIDQLYSDGKLWENKYRAEVRDKLNSYLKKIVAGVRDNFDGEITYSPSDATRLLVNWNEIEFDIVGPMVYWSKKWDNQSAMLKAIRDLKSCRRPVYVTEFGCPAYEGASLWGGDWCRYQGQPYSQEEQAEMIGEYMKLFELGKVDGIFLWVFLENVSPDARGYGILKWNPDAPASRKLGFYMYKSYRRP